MYGPHTETRKALFGETWVRNLGPYLDMANTIQNNMGKYNNNYGSTNDGGGRGRGRGKPSSTITSGYVHRLISKKHTHGISGRVESTLDILTLPKVELPVKLHNLPDVEYRGGRVAKNLKNWEVLTTNEKILNIARGVRIDMISIPVNSGNPMGNRHQSRAQKLVVDRLLVDRVIEAAPVIGVVSNLFIKRKTSGDYRPILNLSDFNDHVRHKHFKMQSIKNAIEISMPYDYYAKVDLETAYDTTAVAAQDRKYLQFWAGDTLYQYRGLPNGLSEAPRKFTELLKPLSILFNYIGIRFISYLDDTLIMNQNKQKLLNQNSIICQVFMYLGFLINTKKSITSPSRQIEFLGFVLDSTTQTVALPEYKVQKIQSLCQNYANMAMCTKRDISSVVGTLHASTTAVIPAPLHYRNLQRQMICAREWETKVCISDSSKMDLKWWVTNLPQWNGAPWKHTDHSLVVNTDASLTGWGAASSHGQEAQ